MENPASDVTPCGPQEVVADETAQGERIDRFLAGHLAGLSRARIQTLIRDGALAVSGRTVCDPSARVNAGDVFVLTIPEPAPARPQAESIALSVLYEDAHLIVIDKPAGLVVHPGAGNETGTLVNALIHHCGDSLSGIGGEKRPGIVHRLDKDTSGVLVVAKTDAAHQGLAAQFADHGRTGPLERLYHALVLGAPSTDFRIEAAIGRDSHDRRRMRLRKDGRTAITHGTTLERFTDREGGAGAAFVELRLETGRTHQIRVHLESIKTPVIGDPDYGRALATKAHKLCDPARELALAFPRQALHAAHLGFAHPVSDEPLAFSSPMPEDMAALLAALRETPFTQA
ncbi:MAG: RluA family pseudouridine synthase [Hyphomicrobiaceae bacterium]|nr:RluA family pseudouridine synthase [Hyphomicrobiaceae bacterium]